MEILACHTELVSKRRSHDLGYSIFQEKYSGQTAYIIQDMMSIVVLMLGYDGNMVAYMDDPDKAAAIVERQNNFLYQKNHWFENIMIVVRKFNKCL